MVFVDTRNASLVTTIDARQEHEFSSGFLTQEARRVTRRRCDTTGWMLALSLECEKFTVLAIKSSLNHYIDP